MVRLFSACQEGVTYERPRLLLFAKTIFLKQFYSIGSLAVASEDKQ